VVGGGVILRRLGAGREVRTMVESPTRLAAVRGMLDKREVHPGARVSLIAANPDDDTRRLDAVAGCEFLDDRIRLRE
jgi:hypothetical protein